MQSLASRPAVRSAAVRPARAGRRAVAVKASYNTGDSKYFDLKDMENTTGAWDLYGKDEKARYNGLQSQFFTQATESLTRRDSLRAFIAAAGIGAIATFGVKGSKDAKLPITIAPEKTENGKGGSVRSRL